MNEIIRTIGFVLAIVAVFGAAVLGFGYIMDENFYPSVYHAQCWSGGVLVFDEILTHEVFWSFYYTKEDGTSVTSLPNDCTFVLLSRGHVLPERPYATQAELEASRLELENFAAIEEWKGG